MHQDKDTPAQDRDVKKRIHRASLLLMGSILLSRLIGFFREWVLAQTVGANSLTDVYYASFTIPDVLNHLMAAGALSISFIPILSGILEKGEGELAKRVFRFVTTYMGLVILALIVVSEIYAVELSRAVAPGFNEEQIVLLTSLIRIILPAQIFFYWGGLAIAVQHTHGRFLLPAIAPIVYNLGIIVFGLLLQESHGVMGFSIGVLVGSFLGHGCLQFFGIRSVGYSPAPYFRLTPEIKAAFKRYIWLTIPVMFGFSIVVADEWFGKYFASSMGPKAVSWLQYARIEMRIPVSVIGQAAGIASFPFLARLWSSGKYDQYASTLLREIQKIWAASLLAAGIFVIHSLPITHFIYGGGKFTTNDLETTSRVLQCFGIGIFFLTVQGLLSRGFYAAQRTWLPSLVGTGISAFAVLFYLNLGRVFGVQGLALSGSMAFALYAIVLWFMLVAHIRKHSQISFASFYQFCGIWLVVAIALTGVAYFISQLGIYQGDRFTAFAEVLISVVTVSGIGIVLLRKVFRKMTDGALF